MQEEENTVDILCHMLSLKPLRDLILEIFSNLNDSVILWY